ncbi:tRNA-2-methylthio-N(6)-dimethylallyladenosine synthase [Spirochaetia bacterium]|nr:tRNA-2-methylthio-N(6)-dimethylallyladenosine synthase [Spirochaetia bacterium]
MNSAESAARELVLTGRGWEKAASGEDADLVLLNTCSVRETAETRLRGRLAQYAALRKKRLFTLIVAGCMAERLGEKLRDEFPAVDYVMGTGGAAALFPEILDAVEKGLPFGGRGEMPAFAFASSHLESGAFRSFVPIMHGCDNFCSYCVVPYVRGREVSREPDSIAAEIASLAEKGVREITLLGQNVNSYRSGSVDFSVLLELVAGWVQGGPVEWVRFLSANPKDLSAATISVMARHPCFCRHIHLPVQHGSNRILAAMNRRYTREQYLDLAAELRAAMPDISLSTDIMVGFPGETEADMEAVLDLMEKVRFNYAYMYHYNVREGTAAAALPGRIPYRTKIERLSRVIALQKAHRVELLTARTGRREKVLVEGVSRKNADEYIARTERDEAAVFSGKAEIGAFVFATLQSLIGTTFRAVLEV